MAYTISSQPRYDHFDTSPYEILPGTFAGWKIGENYWRELQANAGKNLPKAIEITTFLEDKRLRSAVYFESGPFNHLGTPPGKRSGAERNAFTHTEL